MEDTPLGDTPVSADFDDLPNVVGTIKSKFNDAEHGRYQHEQRWLKSYKNFRGIYDSTTQFRETEKSRVFIKITKTKVLAAFGQIIDVLFANKKFPIVVESSPMPEGIAEFAHLDVAGQMQQQQMQPQEEPTDPFGFAGDGKELPPGAMEAQTPENFLGGMAQKYEGANLAEGPSRMGEPQISPSRQSALAMEKCIHDQLQENNAVNVLRHSIFEATLLGTGIVKGPFNETKTLHRWNADGYAPYNRSVPRIESVSCWDFFPDPRATSIDDCEYVIQRHRMSASQLRDLAEKPYFRADNISHCLSKGPDYNDKYYEETIRRESLEEMSDNTRYEVLEYWGKLDSTLALEIGLGDQDDIDALTEVSVNVWICGDRVIRAVLNPFVPYKLPFHAFPYEINYLV